MKTKLGKLLRNMGVVGRRRACRHPDHQLGYSAAGDRSSFHIHQQTQYRLHPGGHVGLGQFGAYGGTIPTPCIDKLAHEGIRFNDYNVEVQCTPSRSAIMTGRHPVRSGTYAVPLPGQGKSGLCPWE
jgi:sulfatase-like protein